MRTPEYFWDALLDTIGRLDTLAAEGERVWPPPAVAGEDFAEQIGDDPIHLLEAESQADRLWRAAASLKSALRHRLFVQLREGGKLPYGEVIYEVMPDYEWEPQDQEAFVEFLGDDWPQAVHWEVRIRNLEKLARARGLDPKTVKDTLLVRLKTSEPKLQKTRVEDAPDWMLSLPEGEVWRADDQFTKEENVD